MEKEQAKKKKLISKSDIIVIVIVVVLALAVLLSPNMYWVTTAKWTDWNDTNRENVYTAMGSENTEERFRLYFQYYNVIHELGHGLIIYNKGVDIDIADEEQLVNDFAVAYWNYYGEPEKMTELYDIVCYAVENVGDNYKNGVDYLENARANSNREDFYASFFNFNDYGWFQFSSVKHSIEQNKSLDEVLSEMGFTDFKLPERTILKHEMTDEAESTAIVNEAVKNINEWGLKFPEAHQSFSGDPNMNSSRAFKNILGIFYLNLF